MECASPAKAEWAVGLKNEEVREAGDLAEDGPNHY